MGATDLLASLLLLLWTTSSADDTSTTSTTAPIESFQLCLDVTSLTISNITMSSAPSKSADTQGILYAYAPDDTSTFQSRTFDISSLQMSFDAADSLIGCWTEPLFHELNLKFKVHEFYHTALKAECTLPTPPIAAGSASDSVTLQTLPYEYNKAVVSVDYTWRWTRGVASDTTSAASSAMSAMAMGMDSDEATDSIMRVPDKDVLVVAEPGLEGAERAEQEEEEERVEEKEREEEEVDWMFVAALTSAILGTVVLCGVCIHQRLYRCALNKDYERIETAFPAKDEKLASVRRISLRHIGSGDERHIMQAHPPGSYTFG